MARSKPPDAFLSYTRFDDQHERGKISEFARRLADMVRAVTGEPLQIFQDVDDIKVGERWSGKLDDTIGAVPFFIPIVTPSYFRSEACRDELNKFLEAEKAKGRGDLILPVYYIECDLLEDEELRTSDPLAEEIHQRQRYDWRKLRHASFNTKTVKLALERLARDIGAARRRAVPPPAAPRSSTQARPGEVFRDGDAEWCPELVVIPPGGFLMGSTEPERQWAITQGAEPQWVDDEQPQHRVRIARTLAVGRFPVTFEQYDPFARATGRHQPGDAGWGRGRKPVINVSWEDAKAYVDWLAAQTGKPYRLLSEAEWEYACRAGTTTRYSWGDEITPDNANYANGLGRTSEVGSYRANPWGLFDMHGNVWEWVEDCWNDRYDGAPGDGSAWIRGDCGQRVLRGGTWRNANWDLRSANRFGRPAHEWIDDYGFRVARTLDA